MRKKAVVLVALALLGAGIASVAAQSGNMVGVEVTTNKPMLVWINGEPVKMQSGFGIGMARAGSNQLTVIHETNRPQEYTVSGGERKIATPRDGRNKVDFDISVRDGDVIKIVADTSSLNVLFDGRTNFGWYHIAKGLEQKIKLDPKMVALHGLDCDTVGVIILRIVRHRYRSKGNFSFARRWEISPAVAFTYCGSTSDHSWPRVGWNCDEPTCTMVVDQTVSLLRVRLTFEKMSKDDTSVGKWRSEDYGHMPKTPAKATVRRVR